MGATGWLTILSCGNRLHERAALTSFTVVLNGCRQGTSIVEEREVKAKQQQLILGVKPWAYWAAMLLWDQTLVSRSGGEQAGRSTTAAWGDSQWELVGVVELVSCLVLLLLGNI